MSQGSTRGGDKNKLLNKIRSNNILKSQLGKKIIETLSRYFRTGRQMQYKRIPESWQISSPPIPLNYFFFYLLIQLRAAVATGQAQELKHLSTQWCPSAPAGRQPSTFRSADVISPACCGLPWGSLLLSCIHRTVKENQQGAILAT